MLNQTYDQTYATVQNAFIRRVYLWMSAGLMLTAVFSLITLSSPSLMQTIFGNRLVFYGLILGEFGLVIALSAAISRLSAPVATLMFLLYAAVNGVTLTSVFLVYTKSSITSTLLVTAVTFGGMAAYGQLTKTDLTSWGNFLFIGLFGIVIASLINMFFQSPMVSWVTSCIGVIVFTGLTAYDAQKIKYLAPIGRVCLK